MLYRKVADRIPGTVCFGIDIWRCHNQSLILQLLAKRPPMLYERGQERYQHKMAHRPLGLGLLNPLRPPCHLCVAGSCAQRLEVLDSAGWLQVSAPGLLRPGPGEPCGFGHMLHYWRAAPHLRLLSDVCHTTYTRPCNNDGARRHVGMYSLSCGLSCYANLHLQNL